MTDRSRRFSKLERFEPRLDVLSLPQRALWPRLAELPIDAVLYGGTALALRLGHRASLDFDLFLPRSFHPSDLRRETDLLRGAEAVQEAPDTLTVRVDGIRVSLFGIRIPALELPDVTSDIGLPVASLRDLTATKLQALPGRAEARDYIDIAALLDHGLDLAEALGGAEALFGPSFSPMLALKALTSFDEGDLPSLPEATKIRLRAATRAVERVPVVGARASSVLPEEVRT